MDLLAALRWPGGSVGLTIPSVTVAGRTVASTIAFHVRKRWRECFPARRLARRAYDGGERVPSPGLKKVLQTGPYDGVPDPSRGGNLVPARVDQSDHPRKRGLASGVAVTPSRLEPA